MLARLWIGRKASTCGRIARTPCARAENSSNRRSGLTQITRRLDLRRRSTARPSSPTPSRSSPSVNRITIAPCPSTRRAQSRLKRATASPMRVPPDQSSAIFEQRFFTAVATLAKGPVAPFLALVIVASFAFSRREWSSGSSLWWPGVALYFAMVLPWFIAVQYQNPTFFQEFFLEHNLERFATNRYQHQQHIWYYLVVVVLAAMPWTVIAVRALVDGIQTSFCEWRARSASNCKPCAGRPG